ncbi:chromosomal replication initiator protein DnaA [Oceaniovalibus guishaninsula]|nr:chromosomal replication initiator protein DnaA [Oceaniovalibus guishaninsula]
MTRDSWGIVKQDLKLKVGHNNFVTWIEPLEFGSLDDGILTFRVPSMFIGNWVSRYFCDQIIDEANARGAGVRRLAFVVGEPANRPVPCNGEPDAAPADKAPAPARTAAPASGMTITGARLNENYTFDAFVVGKPNELAYSAARRVAEGGPVTFNPLFLYGGVGLGKTHLMNAIAWELRARDPGARVLYMSAEQFMYRFVQALRDRQMIDFKQIFRSVDVLMVDDVQFIAGKDSTQEEFFHTFNALIEQGKQIIISADTAPGEISGLERRVVSRLQSGLVVDLHPTSYELRLGILQRKVEQFRDQFAGVRIGEGVLEMVAHRITSNVRELEGALMRLFAFGSLIDRGEVDQEATRECLSDLMRTYDRRASIDEIQRKVADHYNIRISDLVGPKRTRIYSRPRQVAMFLAKEFTDRSLPEIGRRFGGRDHTTILHGIRAIAKLCDTDSQTAEDVDMLRRVLRDI